MPFVHVGGCSAFTDSGGPYVIRIDRLQMMPTPINPLRIVFYDVVATCGSYSPNVGGQLSEGSSCTFQL
ncbi:hypothetical protein [Saccharothrix syringae]|uniref:Uncharacterized protein n=1 Tax=Saccharothrix syringae TaxID=103733 RepID=A0A5Q0H1Y6_SACSY|nr:hypothetical protein [Saccharothrix syringae]QFZ20208.1 hypothetical protein EKG83_24845 [Saccharothrix syringae]